MPNDRHLFDLTFHQSCAGNLVRTKATRAYGNGLRGTVYDCFYLANVGLPGSVSLAVRMGNGSTVNNALSADTAFCHV